MFRHRLAWLVAVSLAPLKLCASLSFLACGCQGCPSRIVAYVSFFDFSTVLIGLSQTCRSCDGTVGMGPLVLSNDCLSWIVHSCQCCLLSRIMSSLTCFACRKEFCPARIVSAWSFLDCSSQSCPPKIVSSLSLLQSLQLLGRFWIVAIRAAS